MLLKSRLVIIFWIAANFYWQSIFKFSDFCRIILKFILGFIRIAVSPVLLRIRTRCKFIIWLRRKPSNAWGLSPTHFLVSRKGSKNAIWFSNFQTTRFLGHKPLFLTSKCLFLAFVKHLRNLSHISFAAGPRHNIGTSINRLLICEKAWDLWTTLIPYPLS